MKLLDAEDPGLPIGEIDRHVDGQEIVSFDPNYKGNHQGEFPPVPAWLKAANVIACPIIYLLPENGFSGLSDHANGGVFLLVMIINSILWGFALVFLLRTMTRLLPARGHKAMQVV